MRRSPDASDKCLPDPSSGSALSDRHSADPRAADHSARVAIPLTHFRAAWRSLRASARLSRFPALPRSTRSDKSNARVPPFAATAGPRSQSFLVPELFTQIFVGAVAEDGYDHRTLPFVVQLASQP